tara:strand:+ start:5853 stop:6842 length:990 start_codon:yes stop_codon:yes gene_type:complete
MKLNTNFFQIRKINLIVVISLIFSLIVGNGIYGFGNDFREIYFKENLNIAGWSDNLGWRISTLTIYGKHIGVHLVTFILAISSGTLISICLNDKKINNSFFFILIFIIILHTWPIIMSTSNAMRQGITMSLIFLSLANLENKNYFKSILFILFSIFTHKSGILFFSTYIYFFLTKYISTKYILKNLKIKKNIYIFYLFCGLFLSLIFYFFLSGVVISDIQKDSRVIYGDFRYHFLFISLCHLFIFTYKHRFLITYDICFFLYFFNFVSIIFLILGLNWQYERLMMMMTIPYILSFNVLLNQMSSYFFLTTVSILLLVMTIFNGMYQSLY